MPLIVTLSVQTRASSELVDISHQVQEVVRESGVQQGFCMLFVPHTTAGLTLNENWDPDVRGDILMTMADVAPHDSRHRHGEGNSPAHIKASLLGANSMVFIEDGHLQLGSWQGIYLAEFDGPRRRKVWVKIMAG